VTVAESIEFIRVGPDTLERFLEFFDGPAFADNPRWAGCFCVFPEAPHPGWDVTAADANRATACALIAGGQLRGVLALDAGAPVGWCNANFGRSYTIVDVDDATTAVVVCFVVAPTHRGRGIARRLLAEACDGLAADGATVVEAHPRTDPGSTDAANHAGTLAMYLDAGFTVAGEAGGTVRVRRAL